MKKLLLLSLFFPLNAQIIIDNPKPLAHLYDLTMTPCEPLIPVSLAADLIQAQTKAFQEIIVKQIEERIRLQEELASLEAFVDIETEEADV